MHRAVSSHLRTNVTPLLTAPGYDAALSNAKRRVANKNTAVRHSTSFVATALVLPARSIAYLPLEATRTTYARILMPPRIIMSGYAYIQACPPGKGDDADASWARVDHR